MREAYWTDGVQRHGKAGRQTPVQRRMTNILWRLGKGSDADAVHSRTIREWEPEQAPSSNPVMVMTLVLIYPTVLKRPRRMV